MGDQVKVHKKLYKSGKMWVAAALVAGVPCWLSHRALMHRLDR
ncbi:KxYKxGKxW signal peptide domain-containing protein [Weissella cibaria]|nr:hypothetical protein [Weissella cibaria]